MNTPDADGQVAPAEPSVDITASPPPRRSLRRRIGVAVATLLFTYLAVAYVLMPGLWKRYFRRHPSMENIPGITYAGDGIPGDPINSSLIGTKQQVMKIMIDAKWYPSDPLTLKSCLEIAEATVLKRPYDEAPVSNLFLFGRKEDLAFEQPVGTDPRKRHHVRFWRTEKVDSDGRPVWIGAAIYDAKVGLSHTTGQITHHTGADIDTERNKLFDDLKGTDDLAEVYIVPGFHKVLQGRNGGGDPWHTDGDLYAGVIKPQIAP